MKKELEEQLVKSHPIIFRDYGGDPTKTCMSWGMACNDGWLFLLSKLCSDIERLIGNKNVIVVADQVKEKFGGLRFYYHVERSQDIFDKLRNKIRDYMCSRMWGVQYNDLIDFKRKYLFRSINEKIRDAVNSAERLSYKTCEKCGNYGTYRKGSWVRVLCDNCEDDYKLPSLK